MIDPTPERAQQAGDSPFPRPWTAETLTQLADYAADAPDQSAMLRDLVDAVRCAALRAPSAREELKTNNEKDAGAGLIGQAIPDVAGTEPRPNTTALDRLAQANAHRPKLWKCPDCHVRCRIENAPNHADTCEALQRAAHSFVGGYEIDPSQPSICQLCGKSHCAASILLSVGGPQT